MSSSEFLRQPGPMEIRVIERDGRRWLQQYKNKPGGNYHEFDWVDVLELPQRGVVRTFRPRESG